MRLFPFYRSRDPGGFTLVELMIVIAVLTVLVFWTFPSMAWAPGVARICALGPVGISDPMIVPATYTDHSGNIDSRPLFYAYARAPDTIPCQDLTPASQPYYIISLRVYQGQTLTCKCTAILMATGQHYTIYKGTKNKMPFSGAIQRAYNDLTIGKKAGSHFIGNI